MKIITVSHVVVPFGEKESEASFCKYVMRRVHSQQKNGLVVEVQYQMSSNGFSALVIGREGVLQCSN